MRFGRGPATVIGVFVTGEGAVSQATLPAAEAELFARKSVAQALRDLVGLFAFWIVIADGTENIETGAQKIRSECRNVGNGFFACVGNDGVASSGAKPEDFRDHATGSHGRDGPRRKASRTDWANRFAGAELDGNGLRAGIAGQACG